MVRKKESRVVYYLVIIQFGLAFFGLGLFLGLVWLKRAERACAALFIHLPS